MPHEPPDARTALSAEEFEQLLALARLEVDDEQREALAGDLQELLGFVAQLFEAPVDDRADAAAEAPPDATGRADAVTASLPRELALSNAPAALGGYFKVPRTVEES